MKRSILLTFSLIVLCSLGFVAKIGNPSAAGRAEVQTGIAGSQTEGFLWHADSEYDLIFKLNLTGAIVASFPSPGPDPRGLTWDGEYLWNADATYQTIYKLNLTGGVVASFRSPGSSPVGLAWDGTYLWTADSSMVEIHKIDPLSGSVVQSFRSPDYDPYGLTWDGTYLWIATRSLDTIWKINHTTGAVVTSFRSPGPDPRGLAWDGTYLWNADATYQTIFKLNLTGGVVAFLPSPGSSPVGLTWVPAIVTYTIATDPSGLEVEVDGTPYTAPESFAWLPGSVHTIYAPSPQSGGTGKQYVFTSWSDAGAQSHSITIGTADRTITADYKTQYYLTVDTDPTGLSPQPTVSPTGPWHDSDTQVTLTAQTVDQYIFDYWAVDETSQGSGVNPTIVTMDQPHTAIAYYTVTAEYPTADFTYSPPEAKADDEVVFDGSASNDPDGTIVSHEWDFGDGATLTETVPIANHTYKEIGTYTVRLTVTDNDGLTNTTTKPINIGKASSSISISTSPTTFTIGESTTISGSLSPTRVAVSVTIQHRPSGGIWTTLTSVTTDSDGSYSYTWTPTTDGTHEIKATWEGDENTLPSESTDQSVTVEAAPTFAWEWLLIAGIGGIAAVALLLVYLKRKP